MSKVLINIKADKEVRDNAREIANNLGLSLSAIINASLKQFIKNREVQFSDKHTTTPYLEGVISNVEMDLKNKKNLSKTFSASDTEKMDKFLDSLK